SSSGHDNTVLFRLKVYLPAHLQADRPVGFGAQVTGGAGGEVVEVSTPEQLAYQLCRSKDHAGKCNDDLPRTITFSGTIDYRNSVGTRAVSACVVKQCTAPAKSEYIDARLGACEGKDSQAMLIDAAGVTPLLVGSNKTVQGLGRHAAIKGRGLTLRGGVSNIVVRNLAITDINPEMVWGGDALTLDDVDRVWIDHNYFARIGRQMIVSGFGKASNVTVSWNEFDGVTDYSATCDNKHYWVMLDLGAADTISFVDNFVHDTAGRMPHAGGMNGATVAMQIANNYFRHISGHAADPQTQLVKLLIEGNYYDQVTTPIQIDATKPGYAFAPVAGNASVGGGVNVDAQPLCDNALHRHCQNNIAAPMPLRSGFPLDTEVLSTLRLTSTALIKPFPADRVPVLVPLLAGPGHIN
ncbi:MAG: pectate lyase, partial [Pseudomonadota bacterium]|nr:pectate lyase [Pseudomonadota bacterium]